LLFLLAITECKMNRAANTHVCCERVNLFHSVKAMKRAAIRPFIASESAKVLSAWQISNKTARGACIARKLQHLH
jgi:hypothetical protein